MMKRFLSGLFAAIFAVTPIASSGYTPDGGFSKPVANTTFAQAVANLPLVNDFVFGSTPTAGTGQTAITNATQLAQYFNALEDNTGTIKINSELESYNTSFTGGNHVFNTNNLQLTGTVDAGGVITPPVSGNEGNYFGSTNSFTTGNIGLSSPAGISVGQVFVQTYIGYYCTTGVSGSGSSATITTTPLLGTGSTSFIGFVPFEFMPYYCANTSASTSTGSSTLTFAAVPSGVAAGQFVSFVSGSNINAAQNYTVTATTSTTVTITPSLSSSDVVGSGKTVIFTPPIRSGQIWSKNTYSPPGYAGKTYFAMELTAQLPQNATAYSGNISAAAPTGQYGAWPAFWVYSSLNGGTYTDASEIDNFEFYNSITRVMSAYDSNVHLGATTGTASLSAPTYYAYHPGSWFVATGLWTYNYGSDLSTIPHKFQMEITPDGVFSFIDGQMLKATSFHWTSDRQMQIGMNLAIGSLAAGLGSNNLFPLNSTNFPETYNIYELKVWSK